MKAGCLLWDHRTPVGRAGRGGWSRPSWVQGHSQRARGLWLSPRTSGEPLGKTDLFKAKLWELFDNGAGCLAVRLLWSSHVFRERLGIHWLCVSFGLFWHRTTTPRLAHPQSTLLVCGDDSLTGRTTQRRKRQVGSWGHSPLEGASARA